MLPDLGRPLGLRGLARGRSRRTTRRPHLLGRRRRSRCWPRARSACCCRWASRWRPSPSIARFGSWRGFAPFTGPLVFALDLRRLGGGRHDVGAGRVLGLGRAQGALRRSRHSRHAPRPTVVVLRQGAAGSADAVGLPRPGGARTGLAAPRPHGPLPAGDGCLRRPLLLDLDRKTDPLRPPRLSRLRADDGALSRRVPGLGRGAVDVEAVAHRRPVLPRRAPHSARCCSALCRAAGGRDSRPGSSSVLAGLFLATGLSTLWAVVKKNDFAAAVVPGIGFAVAFLFVAIVRFPDGNASNRAGSSPRSSRRRPPHPAPPGTRSSPSISATCPSTMPSTQTASTPSRPRKSPIWRATSTTRKRSVRSRTPNGSTSYRRRSATRIEIVATTHASRKNVALISNRPTSAVKSEAQSRLFFCSRYVKDPLRCLSVLGGLSGSIAPSIIDRSTVVVVCSRVRGPARRALNY